MPNVKIYLDNRQWDHASSLLRGELPGLCQLVCGALDVDRSACHLTLMGVDAPGGQPPINVELAILPRADRTPESLRAVAARLRDHIADVTGLAAAIRIATLDPQTYVALK